MSSPLGKYLQLQYTLTGSGTVTPNLNDYQVNFTTDNVPPTISNIVATPASTSVAISWNTNEIASTKVDYGLTSSYGSTTSETDTSPRVTSHSVSLTGLSSCVTYHYRVRSIDAFLNETIGSDNTFTTTGCTGSAAVDSQNTVSVTTTSGGTVALTSGQTGISLSVPSGFAGTDATFQIKQLDKTSVISSTSTPVSYSTIGSYIYDLKALSDVSTTISSFLKPISITLTYASSDVSGIDESSLKIYRWDGAGWNLLSSCTVDTGTRKVTCTTTGFSIFGLFGQTSTTSSSSSSSSGSTSTGSDNNCTRLPPGAKAPEIYAAIPDGLNGVKLYFTDASQPFDKYVLEYGLESGKYIYGADNIGEAGTRTYRVGFLNKNTNYWFRVRAMNGCMPGPWSNEFLGNTKGGLANLAQETGVKRSKAASTLLKEVPLTETNISPAVETVVPTEVQNKPVVMPTESPTTTPTRPNLLEGIGIWIIDLAKSVFSGKF